MNTTSDDECVVMGSDGGLRYLSHRPSLFFFVAVLEVERGSEHLTRATPINSNSTIISSLVPTYAGGGGANDVD